MDRLVAVVLLALAVETDMAEETSVVFEARKLKRKMYKIYILHRGSSARISLIIEVVLSGYS